MKNDLEIEVGQYFEPYGDRAQSRSQRRKGLSGKSRDEVTQPLILEKCKSVHTFGMKFDLKLVFLDMDNKVLATKNVSTKRVVFAPKGTYTIVEIPLD